MTTQLTRLERLIRRLAGPALILASLIACLGWSRPLSAAQFGVTSQAEPVASAAATLPVPPLAPDSPRAALRDFTQLTRSADYAKAARYLDLSAVDQSDGPLLSQRLRDVLDRHLWIDVDQLSPNPHGNGDEGALPDRVQLGTVPGATGKPEPVVIVRHADHDGARWVFSAATVAHIDAWYDHLENRWLLERLPKWSLRFGPHEIRWWQWLSLGPLLVSGFLVGFSITRLSRLLARRVMPERSAETARKLRGPATLGWMMLTCYAILPWLGLYEPGEVFVRRIFSAMLLIAFFWALWQAVELSQHRVSNARWAKSSHTAGSLLQLGARLGKFVVAAFAFVAVLAELGYPVTSIITGLGIGGIALALAAQKTVENLFGAFSLAIDQPFREGDVIQVDGVTGTVEVIGLRSTRLRTVERTLIAIPNGKLAELRIETISARDRMRFYCVLGIAHSSAPQITQILSGVERVLLDNAAILKESVSVRLVAVTDSAMNIEIAAMIGTTDNVQFLEAQQELLLGIVQIVEQAGTGLAHPVSTIRLSEPDQAQLTQVTAAIAAKSQHP